MMSHPKGACPKGGGAPPITAKVRGWGAEYVNVLTKWVHFYLHTCLESREIASSSPTLAFKFQKNKMFLTSSLVMIQYCGEHVFSLFLSQFSTDF